MRKLVGRIKALLLPAERRMALRTAGALLLNALLDFAGLAMLLPVLYFLLDDGENRRAALFFCLLAVGVALLRYGASTALARHRARFLSDLYKRLSLSLYSSYFHRGLLFIRRQGSVRLGREVNALCYTFSQQVLASMMRMASDALLIGLVVIALSIYAPLTAAVLCFAFLPFMIVYAVVIRRGMKAYGERDQAVKREQARIVADTFGGYAELQVNGAFPLLRDSFVEGMDEIVRNRRKIDRILRLPMFLSELSVILGLTLLTVVGGSDVRLLLAVFALAAFRLLPAVRSILSGWTQVQRAAYCIDRLEEGLQSVPEEEPAACEAIAFERTIAFSKLSYAYPDGEPLFSAFDCTIRKGEYVGFSGCSGVGKSTLFNLLLGLLEPDRGAVEVDGQPLTAATRPAWLRRVGYVPQEVFIFNGTLAENIALGCAETDRGRIARILEQVRLGEWLQTLPEGLDTPLEERGGRLSGGQKQRIGIARALYREVDVLLLDEATSALDNRTEQEVGDTLCSLRRGRESLTILAIAHREQSLAHCDRIIHIA